MREMKISDVFHTLMRAESLFVDETERIYNGADVDTDRLAKLQCQYDFLKEDLITTEVDAGRAIDARAPASRNIVDQTRELMAALAEYRGM